MRGLKVSKDYSKEPRKYGKYFLLVVLPCIIGFSCILLKLFSLDRFCIYDIKKKRIGFCLKYELVSQE